MHSQSLIAFVVQKTLECGEILFLLDEWLNGGTFDREDFAITLPHCFLIDCGFRPSMASGFV